MNELNILTEELNELVKRQLSIDTSKENGFEEYMKVVRAIRENSKKAEKLYK
ncbi:MAG: hypothetical protein ACTSPI_04670 [Candidatus Heimdallarchaeaceae archaeon]